MTSPPEERFTRLVEWVTAIAAPLTAVTAILYYFGWTRTNALFGFFGVDPAILAFDIADYLARAAGPAFMPAVVVIAGATFVYALNRAAVRLELFLLHHPLRIRGRSFVVRGPSIVLSYAGLVLLWCGIRVALQLPDHLGIGAAVGITDPIPGALALAGGALILSTGLRLLLQPPEPAPAHPRAASTVSRILLVATVAVAAFWATSVYSQQTGETYATFLNANPAARPEVIIYSEEPLGLWSATPPDTPDSADGRLRYTYTGLRLLTYANERWLLLTGDRNAQGRLTVAILRDDEQLVVRLSA